MKLLIIGASGILGNRLYYDAIKKQKDVWGTYCSHRSEELFYLDVRNNNSLEKVFNLFKPEVVVMTGGITDVDLCTLKPKLAQDVNIKGTVNLLRKTKEYGSKLVYISTDYIFDGENGPYREGNKPNPINKYGETKLEAENIIRSKLKDSLIVRTAQLCGIDHAGKNFVSKIIHNMKSDKKVYAADDLYSTPTYVGFLSEIVMNLIEKKATGIYHGAGAEFIDRYNYINKIACVFGLDKSLIRRVKLKDLKLKAKRPKKCGLKIDKVLREKIVEPYDCVTGLEFLKKDISYT